jgi:hypothetical protein
VRRLTTLVLLFAWGLLAGATLEGFAQETQYAGKLQFVHSSYHSTLASRSSNSPQPNILPASASVLPGNASPWGLEALLLTAKSQLSADRLPRIDTARRELDAALADLERFIGPETENGRRWAAFLRLDELRQELATDQPRVGVLTELEMDMRQNYLGLEYPQFTRVRERLGDYVRSLRYSTAPDLTLQFIEREIDRITRELAEPTDEDFQADSAIGALVNLLSGAGQSPAVVSQLRAQYSYPNLQVNVQEAFVNRLIARSVAEPSPVRECILGTDIYGNACLVGQVYADLKPMSNGVLLSLNMSGQLTSESRGYNRGVVINSTSQSPVFASKNVYITPAGISSSGAGASTNLQTHINSIEHKRRIVRRIASRKAAQQKPLADAIAEERMQRRLTSQYDAQVNQQLTEASAQYNRLTNFSPPELGRIGLSRPQLNFYSTDTGINASALQVAEAQLAANGPSALPRSPSAQIVVEAHQSILTNALEVLLGGRRIRSENLDKYAQQILGRVPEQVLEEASGEPWSIVLASFRPVDIEFDDQAITISIRVTQLTRGEQVLPELFVVSATYVPSFSPDGLLTLNRQGPVDFRFGDARGLRVLTLRTFIKGKLEQAFKEQIELERLNLKDRFPKVGNIAIDSWQLDNGWLQVGLK